MTRKEIEKKAIEILEEIKPFIQSDGGDLEYVELTEDMVLKVKLAGSCHGCAFKTQTLKGGIERAIRMELPDIISVEEA